MTNTQNSPKPNRFVRDAIFTGIFKDKKYVKQLYKSLHPEDKDADDRDIKILTLETTLTTDMYNDLGFLVDNKLIILVEAQTQWSETITIRSWLYLAQTMKNYLEDNKINPYVKKQDYPESEVYVIYSGQRKVKSSISLKESLYTNKKFASDIIINVITQGKNNDIIAQYLFFCRCLTKQRAIYPNDDFKALKTTIEICIKNNILKEWLMEHKKEYCDIYEFLFNPNYVIPTLEATLEREARREAKAEGLAEGRISTLVELVKDGVLSAEQVASRLNMTTEEFEKMYC